MTSWNFVTDGLPYGRGGRKSVIHEANVKYKVGRLSAHDQLNLVVDVDIALEMYRISLLVFLVITLAVHEVELRLCGLSVNQDVAVMLDYTPAGSSTTKSAWCYIITNYCRGGCATKFKYNAHEYDGSSTLASSRYCSSTTMTCCQKQGPSEAKTHTLTYCYDPDDYTSVPTSQIVGGTTVTFEVPTECACDNCYEDDINKEPFSVERCQNFHTFTVT